MRRAGDTITAWTANRLTGEGFPDHHRLSAMRAVDFQHDPANPKLLETTHGSFGL
jgi:hypothetical protein